MIAALVWLLGPAVSVAMRGGTRVTLSTDVGENRTLTLPDGSIVTAGGQTALVAELFKHSRSIALERGEVFLRVAKDPTRPFTVRIGTSAATAVGTAFDVRRMGNESVVAVAEGVVEVSTRSVMHGGALVSRSGAASGQHDSLVLEAGREWKWDGSGSSPEISAVDPNSVAGWRAGRLQYINEPLGLVVADLGRYSNRRLIVNDRRVAQMRTSAVVFEDDIDAWLASLEASLPVRVLHETDGTVEIQLQ